MNALQNIHAVLRPDGIVVDTQPISGRPQVAAGSSILGTLDMCNWVKTISAVDGRIGQVTSAGLFELQHEERFIVTDSFYTGAECLETVSSWQDTRVDRALANRLKRTLGTVTVGQEVRLRLFRRSSP